MRENLRKKEVKGETELKQSGRGEKKNKEVMWDRMSQERKWREKTVTECEENGRGQNIKLEKKDLGGWGGEGRRHEEAKKKS